MAIEVDTVLAAPAEGGRGEGGWVEAGVWLSTLLWKRGSLVLLALAGVGQPGGLWGRVAEELLPPEALTSLLPQDMLAPRAAR